MVPSPSVGKVETDCVRDFRRTTDWRASIAILFSLWAMCRLGVVMARA